jgi:hypothetical protein
MHANLGVPVLVLAAVLNFEIVTPKAQVISRSIKACLENDVNTPNETCFTAALGRSPRAFIPQCLSEFDTTPLDACYAVAIVLEEDCGRGHDAACEQSRIVGSLVHDKLLPDEVDEGAGSRVLPEPQA